MTMKTAKVFQNGRSMAVRIPRQWIEGVEEMELSRRGNDIVLTPVHRQLGDLAQEFAADPVDIKRVKQRKTKPRQIG